MCIHRMARMVRKQLYLSPQQNVRLRRAFVALADRRDAHHAEADCTSFALMQAMHLGEAFTFDRRDFAADGFTPLP